MRALAVILVVIYHTRLALPGGFIGVDVFFVISGYVITRLLVGELDRTGRIDFASFYLRRIRRILPALAALLIPVLAITLWLGPIGGQFATARTAMAAALFNANSYLAGVIGDLQTGYFDPKAELNAFLHTWSLSVEEQFYLGFPLLLGFTWRFGGRRAGMSHRAALVGGLIALGTASFVVSTVLTYTADVSNDHADLAFYLAPSRAWEFAAGAGLVFLGPWAERLRPVVGSTLAWAGLLLILWPSFVFDDGTAFPGLAALVPVLGTACLIVAGEGTARSPVRSMLEWRPAQWAGDLSYSWYLWHWPMIVFAAALWPGSGFAKGAAALLSVVPAFASYHLVENPIRFRPMPSRLATLRLAQACIILPILVGFGFDSGRDALADTTPMTEFDTTFSYHADVLAGCDDLTPHGDRTGGECTWSVESPRGRAVLLGDSNAGHLTEGFVTGMNEAGFDATVTTKSNCPFGAVTLTWYGSPLSRCAEFVARSTEDIIAEKPDLVVLASASDLYLGDDEYGLRLSDSDEDATASGDRAEYWTEGLGRTIAAFSDAGIDVVIVHPLPKHRSWDPSDCAFALWSVSAERCTDTTSRAEVEAARTFAVAAEAEAASGRARTVDFIDDVCPSDPCRTLDDGFWRWRDGGHISVAQSELLAPLFRELVD
jgi:peptidoglycan/LPS O-acetylase OafA/YrhL